MKTNTQKAKRKVNKKNPPKLKVKDFVSILSFLSSGLSEDSQKFFNRELKRSLKETVGLPLDDFFGDLFNKLT